MFQYKSDPQSWENSAGYETKTGRKHAELLFSDKTEHAKGTQNAAVEYGQFLLYTKLFFIIIMFLKG